MASVSDHKPSDAGRAPKIIQPRRIHKPAQRWDLQSSSKPAGSQRWVRAASATTPAANHETRFDKYDTKPDVPEYDDETYEKHLASSDWTKEETDHLMHVYRECHGKWPVVADNYSFTDTSNRTMEDLKSRFYSVSASVLQLSTPITSMTAPEYSLYETLTNFNATQETSRKKLAEAHLYRGRNEVDEESVLLAELQRIMMNASTLDATREDLRNRLNHPRGSSSYEYSTSASLTALWQSLLQADRQRKNPRMRPTGTAADGPAATPTTATSTTAPARPSVSAPSAPAASAASALSDADLQRYGVSTGEKLPNGISFASDRISKPRVAKSTIQTEKIASILAFAQVPEVIPLPSPAVVEQFDKIMTQVHTLLDLRRLAEKENQEIAVREAELAAK